MTPTTLADETWAMLINVMSMPLVLKPLPTVHPPPSWIDLNVIFAFQTEEHMMNSSVVDVRGKVNSSFVQRASCLIQVEYQHISWLRMEWKTVE